MEPFGWSLIGGMLWAVHRVLWRMVLVRRCELLSPATFFFFFWFLVSLKLVPRKFERRDHPIYFISYMHSAI